EQGYTWSQLVDKHLYQGTTNEERKNGEEAISYLITMRDILDKALYKEAIEALFQNSANYTCRPEPKKRGPKNDLRGKQLEYYVFKIYDAVLMKDILEIDIVAPGSRDLTSDIDTTVCVHLLPAWNNKHQTELTWPAIFVNAGFNRNLQEYNISSLLQAFIVYHFNYLNIKLFGMTSSSNRDSNVYSKDDSDRAAYLKMYTDSKDKTAYLIDAEHLSLLTDKDKNKRGQKYTDVLAKAHYETTFADFKQRKERYELAASLYSLREYYDQDDASWNSFVGGFEYHQLNAPNDGKLFDNIVIPAADRTETWYKQSQEWANNLLTETETIQAQLFETEDEVCQDERGQSEEVLGFTLQPDTFRNEYRQACNIQKGQTLTDNQQEDERIYAHHYLYALMLTRTAMIERELDILQGDEATAGSLLHAKAEVMKAYEAAKETKDKWEDDKKELEKKRKKEEDYRKQAQPDNKKFRRLQQNTKHLEQDCNEAYEEASNALKVYLAAIKAYDNLLHHYSLAVNQLQLARIKSNFYAHEAYINFSALYHTVHWQQAGGELSIMRRHVNLCSVLQQIGFRLLHAKQYQAAAKDMQGYAKALKWGEMLYRVAKYEQRAADSFYGLEKWSEDKVINIDVLDKTSILYRLKPETGINADTFLEEQKAKVFYRLLNRGVRLVKEVKKDEGVLPQDKPKKALKIVLNDYLTSRKKTEYTSDDVIKMAFENNDSTWKNGDGKPLQEFLRWLEHVDIQMFKEAIYQMVFMTFEQKLEVKSRAAQSSDTPSSNVRLWGHLFNNIVPINIIQKVQTESITEQKTP
ncbi:MAG: hypothetical protein ACK4PR_08610, partial [Gammaproteobacteria bacterium]